MPRGAVVLLVAFVGVNVAEIPMPTTVIAFAVRSGCCWPSSALGLLGYGETVNMAAPADQTAASNGAQTEAVGTSTLPGVTVGAARLTRLATILGAAGVGEVFLWAVLSAVGGRSGADLFHEHEINAVVVALSFSVVAVVVLRRIPRHALGWLFLGIAQSEGLAVLGSAYAAREPPLPGSGLAAWIGGVAWVPGMGAAALLAPLFPDGRPGSRVGVWLVWAGSASAILGTLAISLTGTLVTDNPVAVAARWQPALLVVANTAFAAAWLCGIVGAALLAVRMWHATGSERRRIAWFFTGFVVLLATTVLPVGEVVQLVGTAFFPVALGVAMLRHGLFDADRLLSRTLLYAVLTTLVAGVFAIGIGLASSALGGTGPTAVVAAVVIALGLSPARELVQRGVDRLLYGQRRDPYSALADLGRRLSAAIAPEELLPIVVGTVTSALRLPYAAVTLGDERTPAASDGDPTPTVVDLPLHHAGKPVGVLTVGLRAAQRHLDPMDERLLLDVARQAGAAAHALRLTRDLRLSRDRLAATRDQERHRIRRDLHDRLGPALAGVILGLGAARRAVAGSSPDAAVLLDHLQSEIRSSLDDVKRLIADLRPTTLEEVGLLAALERHAETVSGRSGRFAVEVTAAGPISALPGPVEVAAYGIGLEAVNNAARHAHASQCRIELELLEDALRLTVRDNGIGLPEATPTGGLGLQSMAERAAELGGHCHVQRTGSGGTLVEAWFPLAASSVAVATQ